MVRLLEAADQYERLGGARPSFVLDEHPDGVHLALMAIDSPYNRAAIWDRRTRSVVWQLERTQAICWLPGGAELFLVRDPEVQTAWNAQFVGERRAWPTSELVCQCPLAGEWLNWCGGVMASPRGDLVAVVWLEQHIGGFELVAIRPEGDEQIAGAGYATEPNGISDPVFSPDGRYLVMGCGRYACWNPEEDPELPSTGGTFRVGHLLIRDLDTGFQREVPIEETFAPGWQPPADAGDSVVDAPVGDPRFETLRECSVPILTGRRVIFRVDRE
jgi:hypothetical protein